MQVFFDTEFAVSTEKREAQRYLISIGLVAQNALVDAGSMQYAWKYAVKRVFWK